MLDAQNLQIRCAVYFPRIATSFAVTYATFLKKNTPKLYKHMELRSHITVYIPCRVSLKASNVTTHQ